ncbi:putative major facilitator superfamily transporter [Rosellinia necatrix]|uniref:Putative major facilitator superfamily transporter n=1 Tax=Rosellinia necatrix TaxID=77044 RepID=A0A1S7UK32_ROSNE|nr:putative major facilitator superfamily transporter [Rosellinia necatrix]
MTGESAELKAADNPALGSNPSSIQNEYQREELPSARLALLGIGLSLGLFLSFLDSSIVATSLFAIGAEFDDMEKVNWVALAYTLSYLGCAVFLARVSDVVGRRNAFLISYIIFIAFSLGCGFAQNLWQLIAFRAIQGLGGSGLYSITMIILPEIAPPRFLQALAAIIGVVITLSSVLGPVLGGVLTHYANWRWIFWINGPIGIVSLVLFLVTWPKPQYLPNTERRSWRELDYLGSSLLIAATVLVVFPFQNAGGATDQWGRAIFLAPLITGLIAFVGVFSWSLFIDRRWGDKIAAAVPMNLVRNRVYASAALNTMFLGFPYILVIYAFPLRCQIVNGKDSLVAGIMLLPMLGSSAIGSGISGRVNGKENRSCETLVIATGFMVLGCGLLTTVSGSVGLEPKALGFLVFVGLGFGLSVSTTTLLAVSQSSIRDHASAQGIVAQVRVFGGSLGIAASSAILGLSLQAEVGGRVRPQQIALAEGGGGGLAPGDLAAIRRAYADAFREDMRVCTIIAGIALLWALGTYTRKRLSHAEQREQQVKKEMERRKAAVVGRCRQQGNTSKAV